MLSIWIIKLNKYRIYKSTGRITQHVKMLDDDYTNVLQVARYGSCIVCYNSSNHTMNVNRDYYTIE